MARVKVDKRALERELGPKVKRLMAELAETGARKASELAPVYTGALAASIHSEETEDGAKYGSDLDYAGYPEFGTFDQPAQPYLRPALDAVAADARRRR